MYHLYLMMPVGGKYVKVKTLEDGKRLQQVIMNHPNFKGLDVCLEKCHGEYWECSCSE